MGLSAFGANEANVNADGARAVEDSALPAVVMYDAQGIVTDCSESAARLFGMTPDEARGRTLDDAAWRFLRTDSTPMPPDESPAALTLRSGSPSRGRLLGIYRERSADVVWVMSYAEPRFDAQQRLTGVSVSFDDVTEHTQQNDALRRALRINYALFQKSPACKAIIGLNFRIHRVNDAYAKEFGRLPEEFVGVPLFDIYAHDPEHVTALRAALEEMLATKQPYEQIECPYQFANQPERGLTYWDVSIQPILDERGEIEFILFSAIDATERCRSQIDLKRLNRELTADLRFFECMNRVDGALQGKTDTVDLMSDVLDAVIECFDCDRAWLMYPCEVDAPLWNIPMERTKPEYPGALALGMRDIPSNDEVRTNIARALASPEPVTFGPDCDFPPPSPEVSAGARAMIVTALHPFGDKPYMFGIHQCSYARTWTELDRRIFGETARRMALALTAVLSIRELRESESNFRRLAENSPDLIIRYDRECRRLYVNPAFEADTGIDRTQGMNQVPGEYWQATLPLEEYIAELRRVIQTGEPAEKVIGYKTTSGEQLTTLMRLVPERNEQGVITGALAIGRNITRIIEAEEEIRQLNQTLEKRVSLRTAQLEASNRELEAFSYSVSHDLKEPLLHITGFSDLLLSESGEKLGPDGLDAIGRIAAAARRMDRLIEDLLQLAQISRRSPVRAPCNLSEMAREIMNEYRRTDAGRKADVSIQPDCVAFADPHLVMVVLQNVLGNAWKYTSREDVAKIEFGCHAQGSDRVFFVRDNGAGFDMSLAGQLFGPFQRLHRAEDYPGSGIGLATVQRIIDRHNGRVWIEGEVNKGATLSFTLPETFE